MASTSKAKENKNKSFHNGMIVKINGLKSKPKLNGNKGLLIQFISAKGRWQLLDIKTNKNMLLKAENIACTNDYLYNEVVKCSELNVCDQFMDAMKAKLKWNRAKIFRKPFESNLYQVLMEQISSTCCIFLDLNAFSHNMMIDVVKVKNEFRFRVMQCWIKDVPNNGYSVGEYLKSDNFKWLNRDQFKWLCDKICALRDIITKLTESDLLDDRPVDEMSVWATNLKETTNEYGLTMCRDIERATIYHGLTKNCPKEIFDFPIDELEKIIKMSETIFDAEIGPGVFLSAVEFYGHSLGWCYTIVK